MIIGTDGAELAVRAGPELHLVAGLLGGGHLVGQRLDPAGVVDQGVRGDPEPASVTRSASSVPAGGVNRSA